MAAPPHHTLASDPALFPLEEYAKGEEMKRVGYLNKEVRRLEEEGHKFWLMKSQADWIKTRRRLASLFNDFALSKNDKIKVWTGFRTYLHVLA